MAKPKKEFDKGVKKAMTYLKKEMLAATNAFALGVLKPDIENVVGVILDKTAKKYGEIVAKYALLEWDKYYLTKHAGARGLDMDAYADAFASFELIQASLKGEDPWKSTVGSHDSIMYV